MKNKASIYILLLLCLNFGCSGTVTNQTNVPVENTAPRTNTAADDSKNKTVQTPDQELQKQIELLAAPAKGSVGAAAVVLETGENVSLNPDKHFPMQSVYKLPIAMVILKQIDEKKLSLAQKIHVGTGDFVRQGQHSPVRDQNPNGADLSIEELLKYAVSESDGTASDVLFNLGGGAEALRNYLDKLGIREIAALNTEKEIGRDWETQYRNYATPEAALSLLRALSEGRGLSESSRAFLLKILTEASTGPKRLKGLLPAGTVVAHKTGTSGTKNGITAATNDIGIIDLPNGRHLAIAVFVSDSPADEAMREAVIAKIAKAAWDKWSATAVKEGRP